MPRDFVLDELTKRNGPELGDTGLPRYSGYVRDEFLKDLSGIQGIRIYRQMRDNDAVIGGILYAIEQLLRGVTWSVVPANDTQEAKKWAEFVDQCLADMDRTWPEVITDALSFLTYGWSLHELVYRFRYPENGSKYNDGLVGWNKLAPRAQSTLLKWEFEDHGKPVGFHQHNLYRGVSSGSSMVYIPEEKYVLFRTTTARDNPEGRSILRNAYVSWFYGRRIAEIEAIGIERDLAGMPVLRAPSTIMGADASSDEKALYATLKKIVRNIKRNEDEGIILPSDIEEGSSNYTYDLKLLSTAGNRQFDTNAIIDRYDLRKAQSVLADFIMLGHEGVGSFALSHDKTDMFAVGVGGFLELLKSPMNNQAIPRLMKINGVPVDLHPTLSCSDIETLSIREISDFLDKTISSGAIRPDENLEKWLRDQIRAPGAGALLETTPKEGQGQDRRDRQSLKDEILAQVRGEQK